MRENESGFRKVGFVGGMQIPIIKRFEAGFVAGLKIVDPELAPLAKRVYTGNFDDSSSGKRAALDLYNHGSSLAKGVEKTDTTWIMSMQRDTGFCEFAGLTRTETSAPGAGHWRSSDRSPEISQPVPSPHASSCEARR